MLFLDVVWRTNSLSRRARAACLAKLAESPFQMGRKVEVALAIPAKMGLVKGRAIECRHQITSRNIASICLPLCQFFAQRRHPTAECAQKAPAEVGLFEHQPQHLLGLASIVHLFLHDGKDRFLKRRQRLPFAGRIRKTLCYSLPEVLHAAGKQLFLGAEIAKESAPGDTGAAADLLHRGPVKTYSSEEFPSGPFDFSKDELMFPFAKRPGILKFRSLFAIGCAKRFVHCMQIMAQSAVL